MARPRALVPIDDIPLVGGALCLDFVNTTGARASSPRERLTRYDDLVVWGERAGMFGEQAAAELRRVATARRAAAARALARAQTLREDLHRVFSDLAAGRLPAAATMAKFERHWRSARRRQELFADNGRFALRFRADAADLERLAPPIVMSAADLLTSERMRLLRRCAECDWLFLDETKNGTRKWCKSMCGNRARSRERYERRRR